MSLFSRFTKLLKSELRHRLHLLQDDDFRKFYVDYLKRRYGRHGSVYERHRDSGPKDPHDPFESYFEERFHTRYQQFHQDGSTSSHSASAASHQDPALAAYYANLEIPYGSDYATVRKAWKDMLQKYHPDKFNGDPEKQHIANEISKGINHAFQALSKHLNGTS